MIQRKNLYKYNQRARCLLLNVGKRMPSEDFYQQLRIQKSKWKCFHLDQDVYFLFMNKRINEKKNSNSEKKTKRKDSLLQIRYSVEQLSKTCSSWTPNWKEITLLLKNSHIVLEDLPSIEDILAEPFKLNMDKQSISIKQEEAWAQLEDLYRRTIEIYPNLQERMNQLSERSFWMWE